MTCLAPLLRQVVKDCHDNGLYIFSWGETSESPGSTPYIQHAQCLVCCMLKWTRRRPAVSRRALAKFDAVDVPLLYDADNDPTMYNRQKAAGVDALILDDVAKITKVPSCTI
jgi:glycerophosphoryl diester phosphodiesterase